MYSTRKRRWTLVATCAFSLAASVGCQTVVGPTAERLNDKPLIVDEAMQKRDWDRTTAFYANGDTVAGGYGYMFRTHETIPDPYKRVVEPAMATANIALLPIGIFVNSPFSTEVYQGVIIPPTHTAMPPLP